MLTVGDSLIAINASPVYTYFGLLGYSFTIPLLWALNISSILLFTAAGTIMLIYSFVPTKSYAIHLLNFSYRKPFWILILFVVILLGIVGVVGLLGFNIPLMGSSTLTLPEDFAASTGINLSVLVFGNFLLPFWLAIVTSLFCFGAKLYHGRVTKNN